MADVQSPSQRVAARMATELDNQTPRLVAKLQADFNGPDRASVSTATWHDMIRQNWSDPMWRKAQSDRMGEVPLVKDAMSAFGIPASALKDVPIQPLPGLASPPDPTQLQPGAPLA